METYLVSGAAICATVAAVWDLLQKRVPNLLTYSAIVIALAARLFFGGWRGALDGLGAGLVGGGIFLVFFLVGGMGAGDVKLMAAIGCLAGLRQTVVILLATALAGGLLAVAYMLLRRRGTRTLRNVGALLSFHARFGLQSHPEINLQNPESVRIPYAVAIAAGTFYSFATQVLGI